MKPRLLPAFLFVLSLHAQQTGSVQGTVINSADRQPVPKAAVRITSMAQDRSYAVAITDSTGRFTLPAIPAGHYFLQANRNGFFPVSYGATKPQQRGTPLILSAGETRNGIALQLVPTTVVSGAVTDAEGDGLGRVSVILYRRRLDRGKPQYFPAGMSASDGTGHFEISGVLPGEYWALARAQFLPVFRTHPVAVAGEQVPAETVASQFYPGVDRLSAASPLIVAAGRDTTGIDFHLNYVSQVSLHGVVTGIPEGAANISISLESESLPLDRNNMVQIPVDAKNPVFQMNGIQAGSYRLVTRAGPRRSVTPVRLTSPENEVNIALTPGVALSGTLTVEGPNATALKNPQVSLTPGDYLFMPAPVRTQVKDGAFHFTELPAGIWDIGVNPLPRGAYIKSMRLGKQDVLLEEMIIDANSKGPLDIVVSTAAPKVEGTVEPAGPATVLAAPTGKLAGIFSFYAMAQADEKGHFTITGLNPGAYRTYAFRELDDEAWQDPKFLLPFEAQSQSVELKEGATETVKLTVIGAAQQ